MSVFLPGGVPDECLVQNWTYQETSYENVTHPDGRIERVINTRKRHCCCHPCSHIFLSLIIMAGFVLVIWIEKDGMNRYLTWDKVECRVTNVDKHDVYADGFSCTTYTYHFELTDDSDSPSYNGCSTFIYEHDSCRNNALYNYGDTH